MFLINDAAVILYIRNKYVIIKAKRMEEDLEEYKHALKNAQVIQAGLLPKKRHFNRLFNDYFIFYKPYHFLSGDFYWVGKNENLTYIVVGDCTGHGISAALTSVLAINLFEYTIMNKKITQTDKILQEVDKKFIESFKNIEDNPYDNPWIDLSIVCINNIEKKLYFSSANRKLLYIRNAIPEVYKGSHYPIGGWQIEEKRNFHSTTIEFQDNDVIYLGSDGFQDQIGGPKNKKYKSKKLHEFLNIISQKTHIEQKKLLDLELKNWRKGNKQVDDICIISVRL